MISQTIPPIIDFKYDVYRRVFNRLNPPDIEHCFILNTVLWPGCGR
jgi:hypothetical protein